MNQERGKIVFWVTIAVVLVAAILVFGFYFPYRNKTKAPTKTTDESTQSDQGVTSSSNFDNKTTTDSETTNSSATIVAPSSNPSTESSDPNYYYNLGLKSTAEKNYSDAISNFSKAIGLNPKVPDYYSKKAEAEVLSNKKDQAIETVNSGLVANPNNILLQNKLDILKSIVK